MFCAAITVTGCSGGRTSPTTVQAATNPDPRLADYKAHVEPVLQANCLRCHGGMNRRGGLNMSTRSALLQGGKDGAVVVPGRPEDSLLIKLVSPGLAEDDPMRMPPKGARLRAEDVAALRKWVAEGVVMDR